MSIKKNVVLINFPAELKSGYIPLINLVRVLSSISGKINVITGNLSSNTLSDQIEIHMVSHDPKNGVISRIFNYLTTQLKISLKILRIIRQIDIAIFFIGGESLILPILTLKLFRKKVFILVAGSPDLVSKINNDRLFMIMRILSDLNMRMADKLILYSPLMIKERNLEKFRNKIMIASEHLIDFDNFNVIVDFNKRDCFVGYLGHLSHLKGVLNFIHAIPQITKRFKNIKFLIAGEGPLKQEIEKYLAVKGLSDHVEILGFIDHKEVPFFMNSLKIFVLPSYTEGLPNVIIEAMACGTPVLANSVGAIPDIIQDNINGFLMDNNSPETIATNLIRSITNLDNNISENAECTVKRRFNYKKVVKNWEEILYGESSGDI